MLSACAPCIGHWINPTACSGQDQDPSNETIAGSYELHIAGTAQNWISVEQILVEFSLKLLNFSWTAQFRTCMG